MVSADERKIIILYIEYKQFPLQWKELISLPFLPPASKFIFDCQKKKKKKRRVGAFVGCYVCCCPVYQIFS